MHTFQLHVPLNKPVVRPPLECRRHLDCKVQFAMVRATRPCSPHVWGGRSRMAYVSTLALAGQSADKLSRQESGSAQQVGHSVRMYIAV